MAASIVIEEFHVTVLVPVRHPKAATAAAIRVVQSRRFHNRLRRAIVHLFRGYASLGGVETRLSR